MNFKKKKNATTVNYGKDTVDVVIFGDEDHTTVRFEYVPKKNRSVLMELVVRGKVNLYAITIFNASSTFTGSSSFPSPMTYSDDTLFYLIREEQKATIIARSNGFKSFITAAKEYFSDCSEIVKYLEGELYEFNNLIELVEDYNFMCK